MSGETEQLTCGHVRVGPKLGYNLVAWRQRCKRKIRVPVGTKSARCWQHRSEK